MKKSKKENIVLLRHIGRALFDSSQNSIDILYMWLEDFFLTSTLADFYC